jgi:hypothetical protein
MPLYLPCCSAHGECDILPYLFPGGYLFLPQLSTTAPALLRMASMSEPYKVFWRPG